MLGQVYGGAGLVVLDAVVLRNLPHHLAGHRPGHWHHLYRGTPAGARTDPSLQVTWGLLSPSSKIDVLHRKKLLLVFP